jgi:hypothetical protein
MNDFTKEWEVGYPHFEKLCKMNSKEIKDKLKSILSGLDIPEHLFDDSAAVKIIISDDTYIGMEVWCYDHLSVSPFGITYIPEHGESRTVLKFTEHFVI